MLNQAIVEAGFFLSRFPVSDMFSVEYRLDRPATAYLWVNQANLAKSWRVVFPDVGFRLANKNLR